MSKYMIKVFLIIACLIGSLSATVIYVDNNLSDGFWQGAYSTLQNALSVAQSGDEIWVAQGTYKPGINQNNSFTLIPGVKLYGGFYGGEVSFADRDHINNTTILSGDIGNIGNSFDNCYHIVSCYDPVSTQTILDGFIIRDGNATDGKGGGGLLLENGASPLIRNCHFYANNSTLQGGAASVQNAPIFENCLFENNQAPQGGGVASTENRIQEGSVLFNHCSFVKNTANLGSALYFEKRETALIDSCVFWLNTDGDFNINSVSLDTRVSSPSIENSAFDDGSVTASRVSNVIYYTSIDPDGPFINTDDYRLDNNHSIPRDWGWYYVQAPLVLNIRVFLESAF